jgi:CRP-like cAMP-binding protein
MTAIMSDELVPLFGDATLRSVPAGASLFRVGDAVVSAFLLLEGRADLVRHSGEGLKMILHRAGPGQVLAEASAWSDVYHCDAVAAEDCVVAALPRAEFLERLLADRHLAELWMRRLARSVQEARLRSEIRSLPRVADRLDAWSGAGNRLPDRGRWQEVAAELGITREALYRELARRRVDRRRA